MFVLTHYPRAPLVMQGGTTFTFVTAGILAALEQARAVAGDREVAIAVGAAALVAFLLLFQRARSKRMLALRHANGA
ncbi:hypothetical protein E3T46_03335 [Cryobacterium sp. Hh11]|uniref:hypothetical protein n=1 Tax=Cryobacterium sp. Hh11 TaxID=2555868 RepID=UPI00106CD7C5|nr:hypothetical protein E3T46_03335 [Cryobacterium sp. Hh11]